MSHFIDIQLKGMLGHFAIDTNFTAPLHGVTALYGPSGCGKTSILRAIAGLNRLSGFVKIGNLVWQDKKTFLPVYKRSIGYVFQEASLFPHLDIRGNLNYGTDKQQRQNTPTFDEVVDLLGIAHLVNRTPHNLSGGESQRVAIGRALLSHPRVLLMDEPLSALDKQTREEIMPFLERLRDQLHLPIFYITHDMGEVERLADNIILIEKGHVIASGPLEKLQADPALPLAKNREAAVSLDARIEKHDKKSGLLSLSVAGTQFMAPAKMVPRTDKVRLRIAAHEVSIAVEKPRPSSILNILPAHILSIHHIDDFETLILLRLGTQKGGAEILARLTHYSCKKLGLKKGLNVFAQIKSVAILARQ